MNYVCVVRPDDDGENEEDRQPLEGSHDEAADPGTGAPGGVGRAPHAPHAPRTSRAAGHHRSLTTSTITVSEHRKQHAAPTIYGLVAALFGSTLVSFEFIKQVLTTSTDYFRVRLTIAFFASNQYLLCV